MRFLDQPGVVSAAQLDHSDPNLARNSFPAVIQPDPAPYGPLEIIHGDSDTTVPVEASLRLCQALDPAETPGDGPYPGGNLNRPCGQAETGGRLTIVEGANHILDLSCFTGKATELLGHLSPELGQLCAPGSVAGEERVRSTLGAAYGRF